MKIIIVVHCIIIITTVLVECMQRRVLYLLISTDRIHHSEIQSVDRLQYRYRYRSLIHTVLNHTTSKIGKSNQGLTSLPPRCDKYDSFDRKPAGRQAGGRHQHYNNNQTIESLTNLKFTHCISIPLLFFIRLTLSYFVHFIHSFFSIPYTIFIS